MAFKSDVKPVICPANLSTSVLFTGPTRLRGYMIQNGTASAGTCIINGLANSTTVSTSTIPVPPRCAYRTPSSGRFKVSVWLAPTETGM